MLMLFSAVLLNFILGTIIYIIWKLLGRLAESKGYVEINYWIWKIVLLAFLCPVGIIVLFGIKKKGLYGFDFWYENSVNSIRNRVVYWKCDKGFHIYEKDASDA